MALLHETIANFVTLRRPLPLQPRHKRVELLDPAGTADAAADGVAAGADAAVLGLDVEAAVEVQALAVAVELGADELAAAEHEIDAVRPRQEGAGDGAGGHAFGAFLLVPADADARPRRHRHADDQPLLDGHDADALARGGRRLAPGQHGGEQADNAGQDHSGAPILRPSVARRGLNRR